MSLHEIVIATAFASIAWFITNYYALNRRFGWQENAIFTAIFASALLILGSII